MRWVALDGTPFIGKPMNYSWQETREECNMLLDAILCEGNWGPFPPENLIADYCIGEYSSECNEAFNQILDRLIADGHQTEEDYITLPYGTYPQSVGGEEE